MKASLVATFTPMATIFCANEFLIIVMGAIATVLLIPRIRRIVQ